jgi:altronate hydrolase
MTRDTVFFDTFAIRAMSLIVGRRLPEPAELMLAADVAVPLSATLTSDLSRGFIAYPRPLRKRTLAFYMTPVTYNQMNQASDQGQVVADQQLPPVHRIEDGDDVATALRQLDPGEVVEVGGDEITIRDPIPQGHKLAVTAVPAGAGVRKYGWPIGTARQAIQPGEHVHCHNLVTQLEGVETYRYEPGPEARSLPEPVAVSFDGYVRSDGRVGTRNEIWILPTVGCVARTAERIARIAGARFRGRVDGVHAFTHPFGCSQLGDDLDRTRRIIAALAAHPNAGGVLIIGLGCENNQIEALLEAAPGLDRDRVRAFAAQSADDETEAGLAALEELVAIAEQDRRQPSPLSALTVGLKCGGSDGFSGLTANPLVGRIADMVAVAKGTPIITEIPEIFGAERPLMNRAISWAVFDRMVGVVNDFKRYFIDHHQPVYENPSPGNIAGGITTLEEKSLGAVQKAGYSPVTQVLRYGERVARSGLTLLEAPGNDAVSSTALTAAGANILLFTTGRGTPLGFPVPTLKIATNSALAAKKSHWIDFDAGCILSGTSLENAARELMQLIVDTASGRSARNELNDEREIAIWKGGVTL